MKKTFRQLLNIAVLLLFSSCGSFFGNDEDEMLGDYNAGFTTKITTKSETNPGDSDFDAETMLEEYYIVSSNATLILTAPDAATYKWTFKDELNKKDLTDEVNFMSGYHSWTQTIMVYFPEAGILEAGNTYRLTLTITTQGGATYTDSCGLVVYEMLDHKYD